ncbi:MAG: excinuclease ABC subunit UvrC [Clostridia bacterium]|nr:excinuclease ABC subunit UvrC [Clostridia bacterium]
MFNIPEELKKLPEKPGVYIMKDKEDNILYVGKAVVLKNRVRQYFQKTNKTERIKKMVSQIDHFEYIVVDSEMEALILECNLIKLHRPKYNVLLKDDKMYPYIKITLNEDYPTLRIVRKKFNDGAKYYGPYTNAYAARETVDYLNKIYSLKQCRKIFKDGKRETPCLNYHIKKCMGICTGNVSKEEYRKVIQQVMAVLDGKSEELLKQIKSEMEEASQNLNFEKAATLRDKMNSIQNLMQKQKIDIYTENDLDVIGIVKHLDRASIEVFNIRNSRMIGGENFLLKEVGEEPEEELVATFIKQYYTGDNVPSKIMFKQELPEQELIREWLLATSGRKSIEFKIPKKGEKLKLIEMAEQNATIAIKNKTDALENESILLELMEVLNLEKLPKRIESYDISNISGTDTVAGMVVFENGKPKRSDYRRLKIKTVEGQNDVACMKEALTRRLKYVVDKTLEKNPFGPAPDLILMDGGITQIRAAQEINDFYGLSIPIYGMVKNDKHRTRALMDIDGREISIAGRAQLFNFVTFLQDEVHNTAIEYHRKLREKNIRKSALDEVEGIGEKKKQALLKHFKSVEKIKEASIEELCEVDGISEKIAQKIKETLLSS